MGSCALCFFPSLLLSLVLGMVTGPLVRPVFAVDQRYGPALRHPFALIFCWLAPRTVKFVIDGRRLFIQKKGILLRLHAVPTFEPKGWALLRDHFPPTLIPTLNEPRVFARKWAPFLMTNFPTHAWPAPVRPAWIFVPG